MFVRILGLLSLCSCELDHTSNTAAFAEIPLKVGLNCEQIIVADAFHILLHQCLKCRSEVEQVPSHLRLVACPIAPAIFRSAFGPLET